MKTLPTLFLTLASLCLGLSGCSKKAADSEAPKAEESEPLQDVTGADEGGEAPTEADPAANSETVPASAAPDDMEADGDGEEKTKKSRSPRKSGTTKAIDDGTEREGEEEEEQPIE